MEHTSVFCALPLTHLKVRANGSVNMCCYQRGELGNLFEQDWRAMWASERARDIRNSTDAGALHPMCVGWGACPFLTQPRVKSHVEFAPEQPVSLELDLPNTHCNVGGTSPTSDTACFMCPRSAVEFVPEPARTLELADRLAVLMPGLRRLRIQGVAEPFWRDLLFTVLERIGFPAYRERCEFSAYTNGTVLSGHRRSRFLEMCPRSTLFFSVDAATPETYRRIRRLDLFDTVVGNIRGFVREKGPNQCVELANNLNILNVDETVAMVELAAELGVPRVQFNPTHNGGSARSDLDQFLVGPANAWIFARAQQQAAARAAELGVHVHFVRPLDLNLASI